MTTVEDPFRLSLKWSEYHLKLVSSCRSKSDRYLRADLSKLSWESLVKYLSNQISISFELRYMRENVKLEHSGWTVTKVESFASYILFSNHCLLSTTIVSFTAAAETQMLRIVSTVSRPSSTGILGKAANTGVCWGTYFQIMLLTEVRRPTFLRVFFSTQCRHNINGRWERGYGSSG